jgi:hypothetical protein
MSNSDKSASEDVLFLILTLAVLAAFAFVAVYGACHGGAL